jgi:hypothetical protein
MLCSPRKIVFLLIFLFAFPALGATKIDWISFTVAGMGSTTSEAGLAVVPVGSVVYGVPLRATFMYYRMETDEMVYVLAQRCFNGAIEARYRCPLNLTIYGRTKIAIDGRNAHVLDDSGKDIKIQVFTKILKQKPADAPK